MTQYDALQVIRPLIEVTGTRNWWIRFSDKTTGRYVIDYTKKTLTINLDLVGNTGRLVFHNELLTQIVDIFSFESRGFHARDYHWRCYAKVFDLEIEKRRQIKDKGVNARKDVLVQDGFDLFA